MLETKLKTLMRQKGISTQELAKQMGRSRATISNYRAKPCYALKDLNRLLDALNLIISRKDPNHPIISINDVIEYHCNESRMLTKNYWINEP